MSQRELNELVAQATGESRRTIDRQGFSLADPFETNFDPQPSDYEFDLRDPLDCYLDWDEAQAERQVALLA